MCHVTQDPSPPALPALPTTYLGDPRLCSSRWGESGETNQSFRGLFAFVNKTSDNIHLNDHVSAVRAHVRTGYRNWNTTKPSSPRILPSGTPCSAGPHYSKWDATRHHASSVIFSNNTKFDREQDHRGDSPHSRIDDSLTFASTASSSPPPERTGQNISKSEFKISRISCSVDDTSQGGASNATRPEDKHGRSVDAVDSIHIMTSSVSSTPLLQPNQKRLGRIYETPVMSRPKHRACKLRRDGSEIARLRFEHAKSLKSSLGGLRSDPFNSFPIESRRSVLEAADYWVNSWAPSQTPSYVKPRSWDAIIAGIFSMTVQDEAAFESHIAISQSFIRQNTAQSEPSAEILYHQNQAIVFMKKRLTSSSIGTGLLLGGLNLLILSVVYGNRKLYTSHKRGLEMMIDTNPTSSEIAILHCYIKGYIVISRFYFRLAKYQTTRTAVTSPSASRNGPLQYPSHPFPPILCKKFASLPPGFSELALECSLSLELLEVLQLISAWNAQIQCVDALQSIAIWFSWDDIEKSLEVLEHVVWPSSLPSLDRRAISAPLTLVLMLYSINAHNRFHSTCIYIRLVQDAVEAVHAFKPGTAAQLDCWLWMSIVVAGCAKEIASVDGGTASLLAAGMFGKEGSIGNWREGREWPAIKKVMRRFFWYEPFGTKWKACWEGHGRFI